MSHKASTSKKNTRKPLKTLKLARRDSNDGDEPPTKKHRVGFTLSNPPVFDLTKDDTVMASSSTSSRLSKPIQSRTVADTKGKAKETRPAVDDEIDSLWVDKYEPTSEAELAVHKRKVEDVRRWLLEAFEGGPSAKLRKYRRILALTGPAGTGKTSTLRVLAKELGFEILEWRNSMSDPGPSTFTHSEPRPDEGLDFDTETLFDKFQAFLTRAMTCNSIFGHRGITTSQRLSTQSVPSYLWTQSTAQRSSKRQLVLLEDLPNLLHLPTQARFQAALRSLCFPTSNVPEPPGPPIVIIVSDTGLRAEQPDGDAWDGSSSGRRWDRKDVLDIRSVLGPELLTSPFVTQIGFNPIATTLMTKALQTLLAAHFGSLEAHEKVGKQPTREVIDIIVASSNGDIRSAIMALQFACVVDFTTPSTKSKGQVARKNVGGTKRTKSVCTVLEAVTRREQSLVLFHLMGKILYNKRKFDPPASHLSAKDAAKERHLDMQLIDPPPLPVWLLHHDRKASRVCIETLTAESPIDSSLLGLYTHQNYTQFCTDVRQCDGVCDGLSWFDSMVGSQSSNSPYAFPILTLSTLHSLPTPVPRSGQKVCKPTWFDMRTKELEALDAVGDVFEWLRRGVDGQTAGGEGPSVSVGRWTYATIATELGGWLRALDRCGGGSAKPKGDDLSEWPSHSQPRTHRLFSHLPWSVGSVGENVLGEDEEGDAGQWDGEEDVRLPGRVHSQGEGHGWLEDDDIEDVD